MRVSGLLRYPVKSMLGEGIQESAVDEKGVVGDRRFALIEQETGLVASAKQPSKWAPLLQCRASLDESRASIQLPDGSTTSSDDPRVDDVLSEYLGRRVSLSSQPPADPHLERLWPKVPGLAPAGVVRKDPYATAMASAAPDTFFDYAPLHLIALSTLEALRAEGRDEFDALRFRPNIILDTDWPGFAEKAWLGRHLQLGDVVIEVVEHTPRCAVPALAHGDLAANPEVLRTVVAKNRLTIGGGRFGCVGVYARVARAGEVAVGDEAALVG